MAASIWFSLMKIFNTETGILARKFVAKGTTIMREGEEGTDAFLIQSGKVGVYVGNASDVPFHVATIGAGEIFGEAALIIDGPRTATVTALEDTTLIVITREKLQKKLDRSDATIKALVSMLMQRIANNNKNIKYGQANFGSLIETIEALYGSMEDNLAVSQRRSLEKKVKPKFDELMVAIKDFKESYFTE